jgi:hypothetical protein
MKNKCEIKKPHAHYCSSSEDKDNIQHSEAAQTKQSNNNLISADKVFTVNTLLKI